VAVPYTPATGARLLVHPEADAPALRRQLLALLQEVATRLGTSGLHLLFCTPQDCEAAAPLGGLQRSSFQFHWSNTANWATFDAWLAALRAPARKQVKRERRLAAQHGLRLRLCPGEALRPADCQALYRFYRHTIEEKGAVAYLSEPFFAALCGPLRHLSLAIFADQGDSPVAGALYFRRGNSLFGRYWGCDRHYDALHFELCYYAPIAWCLEHGVRHFEAGAQGEHKLKRGLLPSLCHSAHFLAHPALRRAVTYFVRQEASAIQDELAWYQQRSPYRQDDASPSAS
ncbi:MAG: GNAT family N-acetyltransferase, partial [Hymenobacter sp.]